MTRCCAVAIPTITTMERRGYLTQAICSVMEQEHPVDQISIAVDHKHEGAWVTRQRALDAVDTEWVFFLDDDDCYYPQHTRLLLDAAREHDADYVFSYWDTTRTGDVLGHFGKEFDPADPHHTTMNILVKTELAKQVGFTPPAPTDIAGGEDWRFLLGCVEAHAKIVHLPEQTWYWRHHGLNTSGQPHKW
jgi:hypothetical protein